MDAGHRAARLTSHQREPSRRAGPCGRSLASDLAQPGAGGGARDLSMPARRHVAEPAGAGLVHGIGCTAGDYAQPQRRRHLASAEQPQSPTRQRPGHLGRIREPAAGKLAAYGWAGHRATPSWNASARPHSRAPGRASPARSARVQATAIT